jgi:hypothetical protein
MYIHPFKYEIKLFKVLKKLKCVLIRMSYLPLVMIRMQAYAVRFQNVNQSLQFAFIRHEISDSVSYNA